MVAHVSTVAFSGMKVLHVDVQVHMSAGLPNFNIVGLADKSVAESRERIRAALNSSGYKLPPKRITVNLSPADIPKEGSHYDLPIIVGILQEIAILPELNQYLIMGELSLDGKIVAVSGVLPAAIEANRVSMRIICPEKNGKEAIWAGDLEIVATSHISQLIQHFTGDIDIPKPEKQEIDSTIQYPDMSDVVGQEHAKKALEIAAAGGHNMLMIGPPGSGKSMLAKRMLGLLPPMITREMLEASMIASISGKMPENGIVFDRQFRDPHHSCSLAAMIGGGRNIKPGEVTLAHNGVLFLDELPEFPRQVLEALRQPMESGNVTVARANAHISYPANFQLIAAMNPCRCGYMGDASRECRKAPICGNEYRNKISGPILDRIDIHVNVPNVDILKIQSSSQKSENTRDIRKRVFAARKMQYERYSGKNFHCNANAEGDFIKDFLNPDRDGLELMRLAVQKFKFSMRGYNRILKVARTVADLAKDEQIGRQHIAMALTFRVQ